MAETVSRILDVATFYHDLLFSYQRALRIYSGPRGSNYVLQSTLNNLLRIEGQGGVDLENSKTFEEAVSKFADFLTKGKIVKSLKLEERNEGEFTVRVEGCIWASRVHRLLNVKDVTCPFAMVPMALYEKFKGTLVNEQDSQYFADGTETIIEPALDLKFAPNTNLEIGNKQR